MLLDDFFKELEEEYMQKKFLPEIKNIFDNHYKQRNPNQQNPQLYLENDYKNTPTIYNKPNTTEIKPAPERLYQDKIAPMVQNTVSKATDWANDKADILLNKKIDYSKPMVPHEKLTDWAIKNIGKVFYPVSSDMYTDGMTDFSRAKKNPNAEVININDVKDKNLQAGLYNYGVKPNERGVHYNTQSEASELFSNSPEVKEFFRQNKDAIKRGEIKEHSFEFNANLNDMIRPKAVGRYTSIQKGKIADIKIDKNGKGTGKLIDRSDFDWRDSNDVGIIKSAINNHGYNMQKKNNYENYFSVIDMLVNMDENLLERMLRTLQIK